MSRRTLYLLDGTALAYRSHFAFARSGLTGPDGSPTGAAFGYTLTLHRLLEEAAPDLAAVAFDGPARTFRHELLPAYKATREKTPPELVAQFPAIKAVTGALGLVVMEREGVEADDLIGTLAREGEAAGCEVFIVSADKDFAQLVSPRVRIYNLLAREGEVEVLDPEGVARKWGVPPRLFGDYLALLGDASDNIPGVPGVGQKTAVELLEAYGDLEGVLREGPRFRKPAVARALVEHAEAARLARRLVAIQTDLMLMPEVEDLVRRPPARGELKRLYTEFGFQSLLARLAGDADSEGARHAYATVTDHPGLAELVEALRGSRQGFVVDTETTGLAPLAARVVGLSFSTAPGTAWYVPLNLPAKGWRESALAALGPLLADPSLPKIGQNIKFDLLALLGEGVRIEGIDFDTMIASYCVNPEERQHGLDALCLKYLDYRKIPTEEIIGKGKARTTMDKVEIERVARYACEDADYTGRLLPVLEPLLAEAGVDELFRELEMPLVPVLARMEQAGLRVDAGRLRALGEELALRLERLEEAAMKKAGRTFNPRSNQQIAALLFDDLELHKAAGMRKPRKTKTGAYSTDASVLETLAPHHELPRLLLEHRELSKLKSTYVDALLEGIHPTTRRIHASFNQAVTATGRLSSSDPNLQNIPVRTEEGRRVRACFVPREPDWVLVSLDYSQIELRIMAHFSGDERLLAAFHRGEDIHRATAALILGKPEAEVTPPERARAKVINFGILYGMGPRRLSQETGLPVPEAAAFIERYFAALPGVREWLRETLELARREGQVTTLLGRRRRLPEIVSPHERLRGLAENMAVNTPIQGTAADIVKLAMIAVDRFLVQERLETALVVQVHDELLFDCPAAEAPRVAAEARQIMEGVVRLQVPLKVEVGQGRDWLEAHP